MQEARAFLSPDELATRYGVPVATIYAWRAKGYGPRGLRIGKHVRYPLDECVRWEGERAREAC